MSDVVQLRIDGVGHCPSFKNKKRVAGNKVFTDRRTQAWMAAAIRSLQSQLRSAFQTSGSATSTADYQPCLTALSEHSTAFDDSRQWIPELHVTCVEVPDGEEGAIIELRIIV